MQLAERGEPIPITQNGVAKAVLQDVGSYERMQKTLALLKLLTLGQEDIEAGRIAPAEAAFDRLLNRKSAPASGA